MAEEKEVTRVAIVPSVMNSYATAVRAHLSAALAYMRVGSEDLMDCEFDSLNHVLDMLEHDAYEMFKSKRKGE